MADFSSETIKARRAWSEVFWAQTENNFNPRILYPAKLSFIVLYEHQTITTKDSLRNAAYRR
jgi:hypothetical protein